MAWVGVVFVYGENGSITGGVHDVNGNMYASLWLGEESKRTSQGGKRNGGVRHNRIDK